MREVWNEPGAFPADKEITHWYCITGGASSGKTTLIHHLKLTGFQTVAEPARAVIDEELSLGHKIEDIRTDEAVFHSKVIAKRIELERDVRAEQLIFFDRGWGDIEGYRRYYDFPESAPAQEGLKTPYRTVFFLEQNGFKNDYARTEDAQKSREIAGIIKEVYAELGGRMGYELVFVPPLPIEERAAFVLGRV